MQFVRFSDQITAILHYWLLMYMLSCKPCHHWE